MKTFNYGKLVVFIILPNRNGFLGSAFLIWSYWIIVACRNKSDIFIRNKPSDFRSSLIGIWWITVCIVIDYKKCKLSAIGFINIKRHIIFRKACRNCTDPAFRQCNLIGSVGKFYWVYFFCCYKLMKLLSKCWKIFRKTVVSVGIHLRTVRQYGFKAHTGSVKHPRIVTVKVCPFFYSAITE